MNKILIFKSQAFPDIDENSEVFRREKVGAGKSISSITSEVRNINTKSFNPDKNAIEDSIKIDNRSHTKYTIGLKFWDEENHKFNDGTWHVEIAALEPDLNIAYFNLIVERLILNPQVPIDVYEYGLFGISDNEEKEDIIFNWYNRCIGEIWVEEEWAKENLKWIKLPEINWK